MQLPEAGLSDGSWCSFCWLAGRSLLRDNTPRRPHAKRGLGQRKKALRVECRSVRAQALTRNKEALPFVELFSPWSDLQKAFIPIRWWLQEMVPSPRHPSAIRCRRQVRQHLRRRAGDSHDQERVHPEADLVQSHVTHSSLPLVQVGSAFASRLSGPPRCSLALRPASSQTTSSRLLSPRLQPLRYLHG